MVKSFIYSSVFLVSLLTGTADAALLLGVAPDAPTTAFNITVSKQGYKTGHINNIQVKPGKVKPLYFSSYIFKLWQFKGAGTATVTVHAGPSSIDFIGAPEDDVKIYYNGHKLQMWKN